MKNMITLSLTVLLLLGGCGTASNDPVSGDEDGNAVNEQEQQENQTKEEKNNTKENSENKKDENETSENGENEEKKDSEKETDGTKKDNDTNNDRSENKTLDKGKAQVVLEDYEEAFKKVISYTTKDGELKEYKTKAALKEHFAHFMSEEKATEMINTYFEMRDGALHVISMDGPTFLLTDKPYEFKEGENGSYKVIQERDNEIIGHANMIYTLVKTDGVWVVDQVEREELE